jgi:hypothetical protein
MVIVADIPDYVIDALEEVRNSGETNMMDYPMVTVLALQYGHDEAAIWLRDNKKQFMSALNTMGERIRNKIEEEAQARQEHYWEDDLVQMNLNEADDYRNEC